MYGNQRAVQGIDTTWQLELLSGSSQTSAVDGTVLAITIEFSLDITVFKDGTDIITVYEGALFVCISLCCYVFAVLCWCECAFV